MIAITVAYATLEKQVEIPLNVAENCTVARAIALSGIVVEFPEINLSETNVGVFGKCVAPDSIVKSGDRIEIYRTLQKDPKELRRTKVVPKKR